MGVEQSPIVEQILEIKNEENVTNTIPHIKETLKNINSALVNYQKKDNYKYYVNNGKFKEFENKILSLSKRMWNLFIGIINTKTADDLSKSQEQYFVQFRQVFSDFGAVIQSCQDFQDRENGTFMICQEAVRKELLTMDRGFTKIYQGADKDKEAKIKSFFEDIKKQPLKLKEITVEQEEKKDESKEKKPEEKKPEEKEKELEKQDSIKSISNKTSQKSVKAPVTEADQIKVFIESFRRLPSVADNNVQKILEVLNEAIVFYKKITGEYKYFEGRILNKSKALSKFFSKQKKFTESLQKELDAFGKFIKLCQEEQNINGESVCVIGCYKKLLSLGKKFKGKYIDKEVKTFFDNLKSKKNQGVKELTNKDQNSTQANPLQKVTDMLNQINQILNKYREETEKDTKKEQKILENIKCVFKIFVSNEELLNADQWRQQINVFGILIKDCWKTVSKVYTMSDKGIRCQLLLMGLTFNGKYDSKEKIKQNLNRKRKSIEKDERILGVLEDARMQLIKEGILKPIQVTFKEENNVIHVSFDTVKQTSKEDLKNNNEKKPETPVNAKKFVGWLYPKGGALEKETPDNWNLQERIEYAELLRKNFHHKRSYSKVNNGVIEVNFENLEGACRHLIDRYKKEKGKVAAEKVESEIKNLLVKMSQKIIELKKENEEENEEEKRKGKKIGISQKFQWRINSFGILVYECNSQSDLWGENFRSEIKKLIINVFGKQGLSLRKTPKMKISEEDIKKYNEYFRKIADKEDQEALSQEKSKKLVSILQTVGFFLLVTFGLIGGVASTIGVIFMAVNFAVYGWWLVLPAIFAVTSFAIFGNELLSFAVNRLFPSPYNAKITIESKSGADSMELNGPKLNVWQRILNGIMYFGRNHFYTMTFTLLSLGFLAAGIAMLFLGGVTMPWLPITLIAIGGVSLLLISGFTLVKSIYDAVKCSHVSSLLNERESLVNAIKSDVTINKALNKQQCNWKNLKNILITKEKFDFTKLDSAVIINNDADAVQKNLPKNLAKIFRIDNSLHKLGIFSEKASSSEIKLAEALANSQYLKIQGVKDIETGLSDCKEFVNNFKTEVKA